MPAPEAMSVPMTAMAAPVSATVPMTAMSMAAAMTSSMPDKGKGTEIVRLDWL
jgi:hypothetical protein